MQQLAVSRYSFIAALHPACPVMFDVFCDFAHCVDMNGDVI